MDSSDSGEDFESADEGFDFEETSLSKKGQCKSDKVCDNIVEVKGRESTNIDAELVHQRLTHVKLENVLEPSRKVSENVSNFKGRESIYNDTEIVNQRLTDVKLDNLPELGRKLCENVTNIKGRESTNYDTEIVHQRVTDVKLEEPKKYDSDNQDYNNGLLKSDISDKFKQKPPKKLGTKLMSSKTSSSVSQTQKEKEENLSMDLLTQESNTNDLSTPKENMNRISKLSSRLKDSDVKTEHLAINKSGSSEGWDCEEEDGFSIPSALLKSNNSNIMPSRHEEDNSWGGWGGWGVSSLLNTATGSVSTFSSQVTAGLSTVLETTVGAPDPETLAQHEGEDNMLVSDDKAAGGFGGLGSLVSGVSLLGSSVINRGLDTLESLGKKTMEVLQEGDPGLKKKRALLFAEQDKPVLSQILREAKEKAEHSDKEQEEKETARKAHFESLFDDFQGMVHLEALEMLSTQCELKLQSLLLGESGTALVDLQETLAQVQELCEIPDDEDESEVLTCEQFNKHVSKCVDGLKIRFSAIKIVQVNDTVTARLDKLGSELEKATIVHQMAISSLAEFTAAAMECFHKSAELVMAKTYHNTVDEAENYVELTGLLCARVSAIANEFTQLLTKNHPIANSSLITNIFLEASNSCSYTRNACQLLVPILQVGAMS